jgi:HNH endonuclease
MITYAEVCAMFDYNPATGWLVNRRTRRRAGTNKFENRMPKRRQVKIGGRTGEVINEANLIWLWMTGAWPTHFVDHIDGDPFNNAWTNLREATNSENSMNRRPVTSTGFKWAYLEPKTGRYIAQIKVNGQNTYLGTFSTPQDAHAAALTLASNLHGKFVRSK